MEVYRTNTKYNQWWLYHDGHWWFSSEDEHSHIHYWFMAKLASRPAKGSYQSSELAFLVSTGETIQQSFSRARSV